jgi:GNAT superfamily N-acetyltransferase
MPLNLAAIQPHIAQMIAHAQDVLGGDALQAACARLRSADTARLRQIIRQREQGERLPWLVAKPLEEIGATQEAPPLPSSGYSVVGSDGSWIAPDRHSPLRFFALNTGLARLTYGPSPAARLWSHSTFHFSDDALYIPAQGRRIPVEGALLSVRMAVDELAALWEAAMDAPTDGPTVALRDGSLILWALQSEDKAVVEHFLPQFLGGMEKFQKACVPLASYVSYPGAQDVCNALRLLVCGKDPEHCGECAGASSDERALCRALADLRDRSLFMRYLQPGQRSALFESASAILDRYGDQRVAFFYIHTGEEIARLEAPAWVMQDATMRAVLHAVVVDQCRRGRGYPPALIEAHEQAVITTGDRALVELMVEEALAERGIVYVRSAKDRSKRERGL